MVCPGQSKQQMLWKYKCVECMIVSLTYQKYEKVFEKPFEHLLHILDIQHNFPVLVDTFALLVGHLKLQ